jgi:hypothetical protein
LPRGSRPSRRGTRGTWSVPCVGTLPGHLPIAHSASQNRRHALESSSPRRTCPYKCPHSRTVTYTFARRWAAE